MDRETKRPLRIDIVTLFVEMFSGPFEHSIVKRAREKGLVEIKVHNLRDWAVDSYKTVDDRPYGGGAGMVIRVDVIDQAVSQIQQEGEPGWVILTDAGGKKFDQQTALRWSRLNRLVLIAGHYEGVDHRVHEQIANEVISVGDYVLSGGEIPVMTMVDAVVRLVPGVLGNEESLTEESHNDGEAEYPQYTRPEEYNGWKVPEVLMSGDHAKIRQWRKTKQTDPGQ